MLLVGSHGFTKPPPGAVLKMAHPLARGLVVMMPLNEAGGMAVRNHATAEAQIATLSGATIPTWGAGKLGPSIRLPGGATPYVNLPLTYVPPPFTIVSLFTPTAVNATFGGIVVSHDQTDNRGYRITVNGSYRPRFTLGAVADYDYTGTGMNVIQNSLNFMAFSMSANAGTGIMYIGCGGGLNVESKAVGTVHADTPTRLSINAPWDAFGSFAGNVEYVSLYNRVLSPDEVYDLSVNPYAMFVSPPRYWLNTVAAAAVTAPMRTLMGVGT